MRSQSIPWSTSGSVGPTARHSLGCGTAGAVVETGAKHDSVSFKQLLQEGGVSRAAWGRGQPAAVRLPSCPWALAAGAPGMRKLSRPLHFNALMFRRSLAISLLKMISLLAEWRRSFSLHFCQKTIGVSRCIMSYHMVKHELTYYIRKVFEHIMSESERKNTCSCSLSWQKLLFSTLDLIPWIANWKKIYI